jgi:anti-anti-sigma factor
MTELATVTFEDRDGIFVAHLAGEIDMSNAESLTKTIGRAVSNQAVGMVVDLSEVTYLDSAGIRLVFELARRLGRRGQRITLVVAERARLQRVLELTDVAAAMPVCRTVEQARSRLLDPERP